MSVRPVRAFVGLGSNMNEPEAQLRRVLPELDGLPDSRLVRCSSFYRTRPVGPVSQDDFVNAVSELQTTLAPRTLLHHLLNLEAEAGRRREGPQWGPRVLDLDLLVYGQDVINEPELVLPHPRLAERAFVLIPFAEIAPEVRVPGQGMIAELAAAIDRDGVQALSQAPLRPA